jgi:hypothetical protein
VAVLADLAEPLGPDATTEIGVTAYQTVRAVAAWAASSGTATIDLFARRGSWRELPLVAVDPDELGRVPDDPLAWFAVQEAVYGRLWSSGMLTGYDLVHCLAGIVTPLPFLVGSGTRRRRRSPSARASCRARTICRTSILLAASGSASTSTRRRPGSDMPLGAAPICRRH